ncbi:hypothetical protein BY996DRAFT_7095140 [Phakopsora pachyrhizi]|nr:hypothetical protein BY996DRAFT_7095140 [Phakopsora pachyrhizi]
MTFKIRYHLHALINFLGFSWDETLFNFDAVELAETSETFNTLKPVQSGITGSEIRDDSVHLSHGTHPPNVPSPILNTRGDIHQIYRDVIDLDHSVNNSPRQNSNDVQPTLREVTSPSARPKSTQESSGSQLSFIKSEPVNFSIKQFNYPKNSAEAEFDIPGWETIQQTNDETEQHFSEGSLKFSRNYENIDRHQSNPEHLERSEGEQSMSSIENEEVKRNSKLAGAVLASKPLFSNKRKATQWDTSMEKPFKNINPKKRKINREDSEIILMNDLLDNTRFQSSIIFDLLNLGATQLGGEFFEKITQTINHVSNITMKTTLYSFFKNLELYMRDRIYNEFTISAEDLDSFATFRPAGEIEIQAVRIYGYAKGKYVCSNKRFIEKIDELKVYKHYQELFSMDSIIKSREELWNKINIVTKNRKANWSNIEKGLNYKKRLVMDLREKFFILVVVVSKVLRDITKDNGGFDVQMKQKEALEIFDETLMNVDLRFKKSKIDISGSADEINFSTEVLANRLTVHFERSYYKPIAQGKYIRSMFFIWLKRSYPSFGVLLVNADKAKKFWTFFKDLAYCIMELEHGNWIKAET